MNILHENCTKGLETWFDKSSVNLKRLSSSQSNYFFVHVVSKYNLKVTIALLVRIAANFSASNKSRYIVETYSKPLEDTYILHV